MSMFSSQRSRHTPLADQPPHLPKPPRRLPRWLILDRGALAFTGPSLILSYALGFFGVSVGAPFQLLVVTEFALIGGLWGLLSRIVPPTRRNRIAHYRPLLAMFPLGLATLGVSSIHSSLSSWHSCSVALVPDTHGTGLSGATCTVLSEALDATPQIRLLPHAYRDAFVGVTRSPELLPRMYQLGTHAIVAVDTKDTQTSRRYDAELTLSVLLRAHRDSPPWHEKNFALTDAGLRSSVQYLRQVLRIRSDAVPHLPQLSDSSRANVEYLLGRAEHDRRGIPNLHRAMAHYETATSIDRTFALAYAATAEAWADLYDAEGRTDSTCLHFALTSSMLALHKAPSSANAQYAVAKAIAAELPNIYPPPLAVRGDARLDQAIAHAQRASEIAPRYAQPYALLVRLYVLKEEYNRAHLSFQRASQVATPSYAAYINEAGALRAEGRLDEAVDVLGQAVALRPDLGLAYYNLACVLARQGRCAQALRSLRLAATCSDYQYHAFVMADPDLARVRGLPEFASVAQMMGVQYPTR